MSIPRATFLLLAAGVCSPVARAGTAADDPLVRYFQALARAESLDLFLGDGEWSEMAIARKRAWSMESVAAPRNPLYWGANQVFDLLLPSEMAVIEAERHPLPGAAGAREPLWILRPGAGLAIGDYVPVNRGGDEEPGLVSVRAAAEMRAYWGSWAGTVAPGFGVDGGQGIPELALDTGDWWLGWRGDHLLAGFGRRDRWLGPGRRGSLLLSHNATPLPMGNVAVEGHLPGWFHRVGRWRAETSVGWFDQPRDDVDHPGLLLMDFRWLPVPQFEMGLTRSSIFCGEGRPWPGLFPLLVPLEPHVYDDPEKEEPDQNEQAALDFRATLPLAVWTGLPVNWVELWWQYGGEDLIGREQWGIPYPSLAGVANLYGAEISAGPVVATVEGARILDDYFRWYVSHRVYHDGFTQNGRVLGHEAGTDSESLYMALGLLRWPWFARLWHERIHRVGVVESLEENLLALSTDENRWRLGAELARVEDTGAQWSLAYTYETVEGRDFVPETSETFHRVAFTWRLQPLSTLR